MDSALAKLREPGGEAVTQLARLMVEDMTATPLRELLHPRWVASQLATALEASTRGDLLRDFVARRLEAGVEAWGDEDQTARAWLPAEVDAPLREVLRHPWSPDPQLTLRLIDQPAMRALVAEVLTTMLTRFRARMSNLDGGLLKNLGGRAARRGRGLFGGVAELADSVVEVVRDEVEHGLDEKVREFVRGATRDALQAIADHVADPAHADAFGELRVGVLDVLLDTPVGELLDEVDKAQPLAIVDVVRTALQRAVQDPQFVDRTEDRVAAVLDEVGDGTLAAWLQEVGLLDVWTDATADFLAQRLSRIVGGDAFGAWWARLHARDGG